MNEGYVILDGQIVEVTIICRHQDSDMVNILYTDDDLLRHITEIPIEAVYPDREMAETVLRRWGGGMTLDEVIEKAKKRAEDAMTGDEWQEAVNTRFFLEQLKSLTKKMEVIKSWK